VTRFDTIEHSSLSDVGVRRSINQDSHAVQLARDDQQWEQRGHLFLVADGMGAHAVGDKASEQAVGLIPHMYLKYLAHGPVAALRRAFVEANASIHACGQANRDFAGMGTTATALLLRPEGAWISHVGDSRVYRVRDGVIEQLSYDHSLVWEYARIKGIDPSEVHDIPPNVIHRCLGPEPLVQVDIEGPHNVLPGDVFVLCSDGLSGPVPDGEIGAAASALPPAEACRYLVDLANLRGGPDNITVMIVRITERRGGNGVPSAAAPHAKASAGQSGVWLRRPMPRTPWWLLAMIIGIFLVLCSSILKHYQLTDAALALFIFAVASVLAGFAGLGSHFLRERQQQTTEPEGAEPRVHRQAPCRIELPLLDRLFEVVRTVHQRAQEKDWELDWSPVEDHERRAKTAEEQGDLVGAYREYCRALFPLARALERRRQKGDTV
jgi:protein phosphatase